MWPPATVAGIVLGGFLMLASTRSVATLLVSTLVALLFLATAAPALATDPQPWYSSSSPLTASDDGTIRAKAFGTAYEKDGYLKNHTFYRDPHGYNRGAYTETSYSYKESSPNGEQWSAKIGKDQSARNTTNDWVDQYDANDYSSRSASYGRVHVKTCEDQYLSPDPCSRQPYFTFNI